jgi:hypothetical protein
VVGFNEVTSPAFHFGLYVGLRGSGKTSLYREHAGALILNLDLHSTPKPAPDAPPPKNQVFPIVDRYGRIRGATGELLPRIRWQHFEDVIEQLLLAAQKDHPRPQTIVFDTIPASLALKLKRQAEIDLGNPLAEFDDIPGGRPTQGAYGRTYDTYLKMAVDLRTAGFGVHYIAHIATERIPLGEGKDGEPQGYKLMTGHNVPEKIFKRISATLEFLACIEQVEEVAPSVDAKGKTTYGGRVKKRYLTNLSEALDDAEKSSGARIQLPGPIELPPYNAWQAFEAAYLKAAGVAPE